MKEPAGVPDDSSSVLHAGISALQTKTWLDYQAGGNPLKVYWSDGDRINVNGITSLGLAVQEGVKTQVADFSVYGAEAPFNVIYPSSIVTDLTYDTEGYIGIEMPSVQKYHPTSFAEGSAIMCGYSETQTLNLTNLCAAVRVNVKGTEDIVSASVISVSTPLCGKFRLNPGNGHLKLVEGVNEINLEFTENIKLTENGVDFFFTIPAGNYSEGISFYFKRADGRNLECIWRPQTTLEAGKLYSFNDVDYVPGAKDITTPQEWEEFAAAVNGNTEGINLYLYKGGFVRLGADIQADNLTPITEDFTYIFDGNGKVITRDNATEPLFSSISGEVKNLTLAGSLNLGAESGAPLAYTLNAGGKITSCTNNMNVQADTESDTYVSGLVTVMQGGTIDSCTNNGTVDVRIDVDKGIYYVALAGIVADMQGTDEDESILTDCTNSPSAALTLTPALTFKSASATDDRGMKLCAFGGIAGWVSNPAKYTFTNCDNKGAITISGKEIANANGNSPRPISVGGIVGLAAKVEDTGLMSDPNSYEDDSYDISLVDCDNSGLIYNCGVNYSSTKESNNKVFTGGIAGSLAGRQGKYAKMTSCTSTGDIITYDIVKDTPGYVVSGRPAYCMVAGGLVGFGGYLNMDKCEVNCQIGNGKRPMVAWGGCIGYTMSPFVLKDSKISLSGYYQRLAGYKMNRAVVAVVPVKYSSSAMNLKPNIEGSQIVGTLAVSGYILSSGSTLSSDDLTDISSSLTTKVCGDLAKVTSNLTCGEGYTANTGVDYESATITYSAQ